MQIRRIEYDSPLDALIAITKSLTGYENRYAMASEDFLTNTVRG